MKARLPWQPSKREQKVMYEEINRQIKAADEQYWADIVAMMLLALHEHEKKKYNKAYGKKRMKDFFVDFDAIHTDLISYYELNKTDAPWIAHRKLKELGIDVKEWCKGNFE